jgi:signal transduction histidine kinase
MPNRNSRTAARLGLALMGAACAALLALEIYQAFWNAPELRRSRDLVAHTYDVILTARALERTIKEAEQRQRSLLLTGAPSDMVAYRAAIFEVPEALARLKRMTADNAEEQRRLPNLEYQVKIKLAALQRTADILESKGRDAALRAFRADPALDATTMRAIDGLVQSTVDAETSLLKERTRRAAEDERETALEGLAATVLGVAIILLGSALLYYGYSERVRQQTALEQTRAALAQSQKMEALGQLTGGIAHDFNNLLTVIIGSIETLQRRLAAGELDVGRFIDAARRSAERAASLTARLLAFARRQALDPKPLDPNKLVAGVVDMLQRSLGERIQVEAVLAGGAWWINADQNQLESAVLNLILNARDAMPHGGKLTIETGNVDLDDAYARAHEELAPGHYAMIAVSDNGVGMSPEVIAKAFDPFFTTKQPGHGTGLGLSQVYGFIKQSGGHIKIYSEVGQGSTVKLYLPRLQTLTAAEIVAESQPAPAGSVKESILVVEDDPDVRAFAEQALSELGYRVRIAADAASALRVLEHAPRIDLLFTDVGLPNGVNGRQLADEARRRWPALKVVFTTGYARNAIIHQGRLDPGVELVAKPFTQADLARRIRTVLDA